MNLLVVLRFPSTHTKPDVPAEKIADEGERETKAFTKRYISLQHARIHHIFFSMELNCELQISLSRSLIASVCSQTYFLKKTPKQVFPETADSRSTELIALDIKSSYFFQWPSNLKNAAKCVLSWIYATVATKSNSSQSAVIWSYRKQNRKTLQQKPIFQNIRMIVPGAKTY